MLMSVCRNEALTPAAASWERGRGRGRESEEEREREEERGRCLVVEILGDLGEGRAMKTVRARGKGGRVWWQVSVRIYLEGRRGELQLAPDRSDIRGRRRGAC